MAMNYKPSMTKAELLEIATANGVQADDSMTCLLYTSQNCR